MVSNRARVIVTREVRACFFELAVTAVCPCRTYAERQSESVVADITANVERLQHVKSEQRLHEAKRSTDRDRLLRAVLSTTVADSGAVESITIAGLGSPLRPASFPTPYPQSETGTHDSVPVVSLIDVSPCSSLITQPSESFLRLLVACGAVAALRGCCTEPIRASDCRLCQWRFTLLAASSRCTAVCG